MFEPPATSGFSAALADNFFLHWHYVSQRKQVLIGDVPKDSLPFVSPILFVDGHAAIEDFTSTIHADPYYCSEETKDWIWYEPKIPPAP